MNRSSLFEMIQVVLTQLPLLLTVFVCAILALVRWKRHPKVSLSVATSMVLLFLHTLIFAFVFTFAPEWLARVFAVRPDRSIIVISFIYNSSLAIVLLILLVGVFMQRGPSEQRNGSGMTYGIR